MHATQPQGGACPEPTPAPAYPAADQGDPYAVVGVCAYCATPNVERVLITATDGTNPRLVCADTAFCAGAQRVAGDGGYVVTDAGYQALTATADADSAPGTVARVLRSAATYLERHGWIQGTYYDATTGVFTPPSCLVGAIGMVCYGGPVDAPAQHFDDPGFLDFEEAVLHLDRYLMVEDGTESYEFNDAKGRRLDDVTHVLRQAADTPAHELIDAIKAIDAHNAQMAAIADLLTPCGIWGEQSTSAAPQGGDA
jgi:hypothetical protein